MSMKMLQGIRERNQKIEEQLEEDRLKLQEIKNKKEKNYDKDFNGLRKDIINLKQCFENQCNEIKKLIKTRTVVKTEENIKKERKEETDPVPMFIPEIDTSDFDINTGKDDNEEVRDMNFESGLNALDGLTK